MGFIDEKSCADAAIELLKQPCQGDIVGYCTSEGKVVRFNMITTEYASGIPGQYIKTYMKPKCSSDGTPKPKKALSYYLKYKEKDGILNE